MSGRFCLLSSIVILFGLAGVASAYTTGIVLKCDAGDDETAVQAGWTQVVDGWNLNVAGTGLNVKLATGDPTAIEARDEVGDTPVGPLSELERDFYFANDRNTSPSNDFILTFNGLADGAYRVKSYHHRANEVPVPIPSVTVSGADSVISVPHDVMQNHLVMLIPAETLFTVSGGGDVAIRFKGPDWTGVEGESGQAYFNGFILEYFGSQNQAPYDPSPADKSENLCPDGLTQLTWSAGASAITHNIYFGTEPNDVNDGTAVGDTGLGSASWTPPSLDMGVTYYWRVDEVTGSGTWEGGIWRFTTNDGNAFDPVPGDGWRGLALDTDLTWGSGCLATSHDVYLSTTLSDVENMVPGAKHTTMAPTYDPGTLLATTTYYWRVVEKSATETWTGPVWSFTTGTGVSGTVMYYRFDGVEGTSLPSSLPDTTGNVTFTRYIGSGSLEYGESNPVVNEAAGTSAVFEPNVGLYRADTGDNDLLRLDGYQYTIEMWLNANTLPDTGDDPRLDDEDEKGAMLVTKSNDWSLDLHLNFGVAFFHKGIELDRQNMHIESGRNSIKQNEWHHVAAVFDMTDPDATHKIYVDGKLMATKSSPFQNPYDDANYVSIGMEKPDDVNTAHFFDGKIDELRISNVALGPADFLLVPGPEWARSPNPGDKQTRVDPNVVLTWVPGAGQTKHDVYLGTDKDVVKNAGTGSDEYLGQVTDANQWPAMGLLSLDYRTTYYWRVDEIGAETYKGIVWGFRTRSVVDDPNLVLWYTFDEGSGMTAVDLSGHDYDGIIDGPGDGPNWDPNDGEAGCLVFDDDTAISLSNDDMLTNIFGKISIAVWLKDAYRLDGRVFENNWLFDSSYGGDVDLQAAVVDTNGVVYWRAGTDTNDVLTWNLDDQDPTQLEEWHHWVFMKDESAGEISIYFDGKLEASSSTVDQSLNFLRDARFRIGAQGSANNDLVARVDDFMVFDYALSDTDIQILFRRGDLALAWDPQPRNGATDLPRQVTLTWSPGDYAVQHDVYFGTNFDDVNNADTASTGIYYGRQGPNTYNGLGQLALNTAYYWRIDEVNDNDPNLWKGKVWRFKTANYIVLDDFESYHEDLDDLYWFYGGNWLDGIDNGTGATLYLGVLGEPANTGKQSLFYAYQNQFAYYSEAERVINPGERDWTEAGVKALTLYFYGDPGNDASSTEQLYVGIEDSGTYADIAYGAKAGEDMNDIQEAEWHEWNVALSDFTNVTLSNVQHLYILIGQRGSTTSGGNGTLYFDDIRLAPPRCVPQYGPQYDFSGNCIVDYADIALMAEDWLKSDWVLTIQTPTASPVGWWKLDENSGTTAADSSGNNNTGTVEGDFAWVTGHIGTHALDLQGNGSRVLVPHKAILNPTSRVTAMAWVNYSESQDYSARLIAKGADADDSEAYVIQIGEDDEASFFIRTDPNHELEAVDSPENSLPHDAWVHVAGSYDGDAVNVYVNGRLAGSERVGAQTIIVDTNGLAIGDAVDVDRALIGKVDDVRVYSAALPEAQIAHIATQGTGYVPLVSDYDLHDSEAQGLKAVNFKDFAELMTAWLEQKLWPAE